MQKGPLVAVLILAFVLFGLFGFSYVKNQGPGKYDAFAQCLTERDAVFYGAFWCPACASQKQIFGKSESALPYFECSNPDRSSNETCVEEQIFSYPTWKFNDGEYVCATGLSILELSTVTGCESPGLDLSSYSAREYLEDNLFKPFEETGASEEEVNIQRAELTTKVESSLGQIGLTIDTAEARDIIQLQLNAKCNNNSTVITDVGEEG